MVQANLPIILEDALLIAAYILNRVPSKSVPTTPYELWNGAILIAAYIVNRVPSKSVPTTLYELWDGAKPNLKHMRPWGSRVYVHNTSHKYGKLGPRA
jgi:hypothetical protein